MNCSNRTGLINNPIPIPVGAGDSDVGELSDAVYVNCFTSGSAALNSGNNPNASGALNRHQRDFLDKSMNSRALGSSANAGISDKFSEKVNFFDKPVFFLGEYDLETRREAIDLTQQARREAKEAAIQEIRRNARSDLNGSGVGLIQEIRSVARQVQAQGKGINPGRGRGRGR